MAENKWKWVVQWSNIFSYRFTLIIELQYCLFQFFKANVMRNFTYLVFNSPPLAYNGMTLEFCGGEC